MVYFPIEHGQFCFFYSSHWLGTICEMVRIVHSSHGKSKCQSIRSDYQTTRVLSRASWSSIKWMACTDIILLDIFPPTSEYLSIILFLFCFSSFLQTWKLLFLLLASIRICIMLWAYYCFVDMSVITWIQVVSLRILLVRKRKLSLSWTLNFTIWKPLCQMRESYT